MTVRNVLVVGGGFTGLVAAVALAQRRVRVTLAERVPEFLPVGHGITMQGNLLRSFVKIGAYERIAERGWGFNGLMMYNADGSVIMQVPTAPMGGEDLPETMGALRPEVHAVLVERAREEGVELRLGTELLSFENADDHVTTVLSSGDVESWDLVIGADGIKSTMRAMLGIPEDKAPSGLGIWRGVVDRTPEMGVAGLAYGGDEYKAGFTPISATQCYGYVLTRPERRQNGLSDAAEFRDLLSSYHGPWDTIRARISDGAFLNFQPIEWLFVEGPWHHGRVILIGDAVHACPPLIAQGAAQCSEDATILPEFITADGDLETQLTAFEQRRKPRVKGVVDASMQLAFWESHPGTPDADPARVMGETMHALAQPA